jgi:hypothetical protein
MSFWHWGRDGRPLITRDVHEEAMLKQLLKGQASLELTQRDHMGPGFQTHQEYFVMVLTDPYYEHSPEMLERAVIFVRHFRGWAEALAEAEAIKYYPRWRWQLWILKALR